MSTAWVPVLRLLRSQGAAFVESPAAENGNLPDPPEGTSPRSCTLLCICV